MTSGYHTYITSSVACLPCTLAAAGAKPAMHTGKTKAKGWMGVAVPEKTDTDCMQHQLVLATIGSRPNPHLSGDQPRLPPLDSISCSTSRRRPLTAAAVTSPGSCSSCSSTFPGAASCHSHSCRATAMTYTPQSYPFL